ncbi:hypothetical protein PAXINDRAFT_182808, partial [Paxillus involutus ATCC 200175]
MLSFVVALGLVVFDTSDTLTLAMMIPIWGVVILLALLPLWWKRSPSFAFAVAHPRRRLQQRFPGVHSSTDYNLVSNPSYRQPTPNDPPPSSGMAHFPPRVLSSLRKALAWLQLVWRRLATRNVLRRRVWSFVLRGLQFYTGLPCRPGVTAEKDQRRNAGCGTIRRLTGVNGSNEPANILPSRLPTSTHTLLDPSSASDTSQEATPSAPLAEPFPQNSAQHTSVQDISSPPEPPPRVDDNRESIPLTPMGSRQNSPQSTHLGEALANTQQPVSQFQRGEPVQLSSHQSHDQASIRPSLLDLLASVKPAVPQQLKRYNRKFEINQIDYTQTIQPRRPDYPVCNSEVKRWHRRVHPEGAPYFALASKSVRSGI